MNAPYLCYRDLDFIFVYIYVFFLVIVSINLTHTVDHVGETLPGCCLQRWLLLSSQCNAADPQGEEGYHQPAHARPKVDHQDEAFDRLRPWQLWELTLPSPCDLFGRLQSPWYSQEATTGRLCSHLPAQVSPPHLPARLVGHEGLDSTALSRGWLDMGGAEQ